MDCRAEGEASPIVTGPSMLSAFVVSVVGVVVVGGGVVERREVVELDVDRGKPQAPTAALADPLALAPSAAFGLRSSPAKFSPPPPPSPPFLSVRRHPSARPGTRTHPSVSPCPAFCCWGRMSRHPKPSITYMPPGLPARTALSVSRKTSQNVICASGGPSATWARPGTALFSPTRCVSMRLSIVHLCFCCMINAAPYIGWQNDYCQAWHIYMRVIDMYPIGHIPRCGLVAVEHAERSRTNGTMNHGCCGVRLTHGLFPFVHIGSLRTIDQLLLLL